MSVPIVIAGTTFNYPTSGESPNWAEEASAYAVAVGEVLNTLLGSGDILQTSSTIINNTSSSVNVNGLLFDSGTIRAANISYSIYRISTSNTSGHAENGSIFIIFDDSAIDDNKWKMTQSVNGNSGVILSIDHNGQFSYKSNDIGSAGYSGLMKFSAKTLSKI